MNIRRYSSCLLIPALKQNVKRPLTVRLARNCRMVKAGGRPADKTNPRLALSHGAAVHRLCSVKRQLDRGQWFVSRTTSRKRTLTAPIFTLNVARGQPITPIDFSIRAGPHRQRVIGFEYIKTCLNDTIPVPCISFYQERKTLIILGGYLVGAPRLEPGTR
jgi:hypothetical protein